MSWNRNEHPLDAAVTGFLLNTIPPLIYHIKDLMFKSNFVTNQLPIESPPGTSEYSWRHFQRSHFDCRDVRVIVAASQPRIRASLYQNCTVKATKVKCKSMGLCQLPLGLYRQRTQIASMCGKALDYKIKIDEDR
jgi:hypothetical protein